MLRNAVPFAVLTLAIPLHAQTLRVPFHTANGMILLDGQVNGKAAVLLLDTGADFTVISPEASGLPSMPHSPTSPNRE
jgi:hypothetical protein